MVNTPGVAADLSHISSVAVCTLRMWNSLTNRTTETTGKEAVLTLMESEQKISGFLPKDDGLKNALTGTDVVVIPAGIPRSSSLAPDPWRCQLT